MEHYPEKEMYCQKDYLLENCVILGLYEKEYLDMHQIDNYISIAGKAGFESDEYHFGGNRKSAIRGQDHGKCK